MVLLSKVFDDAHVMPTLAQVSLESCCAESETSFFGSVDPAPLWTLQLESWIHPSGESYPLHLSAFSLAPSALLPRSCSATEGLPYHSAQACTWLEQHTRTNPAVGGDAGGRPWGWENSKADPAPPLCHMWHRWGKMPSPLCPLPGMTGQVSADPDVCESGESFLRAGEMIVPLAPSSNLRDVPWTSPGQNKP